MNEDRFHQYEHIGSGLPLNVCPCGHCVVSRDVFSPSTVHAIVQIVDGWVIVLSLHKTRAGAEAALSKLSPYGAYIQERDLVE